MTKIVLAISIALFVLIALFLVLSIFYLKLGWFKRLYHDLLGWHEPDKSAGETFDGCSVHAKCKYCGEDIMQDSQGNWF
jgi:hypothetical protein